MNRPLPQERSAAAPSPVRRRLRVEGTVQGVGFRPFVHAVATRLGLGGLVGNDTRGVFVEVEGEAGAVDAFVGALAREAPPLAVIEAVTVETLEPTGQDGFVIAASEGAGERQVLIAPDTATCADCLAEVLDPAERRHRYPFTNCTNCGPRFTIIRDVPYDRPNTTMAGFAMCGACAREYHDPTDRRFHAQPVCCPACGPRLRLLDADGVEHPGDPIDETVALLRAGRILAIKGLGGYHLAALAADQEAVATLRARKHREDKPFAVMTGDLAAARALCVVDAEEERLLTSPRRPIVLLRRRPDAPVADAVSPGNRSLGVMLPYTPLHHLLARDLGEPFVLTSGNVSDEPIAYVDDDARERLAGIADHFLVSDRPIHMRTDDSVVRVVEGREMPLRRSRGYVPQPLLLPWVAPRHVLGVGAELKNTFCLVKGRHAFVSHHIGDLENYETLRSYLEGIDHFGKLFEIAPELVAHDLHPEYLSTKHALDLDDVELVGVQHHHAHIASCLAENGEEGRVIGVAFDGLGYGSDGTLWGGEFLLADLTGFERAGHLAPVPMPGGTAAIKEPWRMAAAYLDAAFEGDPPEGLAVARRHGERWERARTMARTGLSAPLTSSAGRLFDAVSAVVGLRDAVNYEGQAAIELEQLADPAEAGAYPVGIEAGPGGRPGVEAGPGGRPGVEAGPGGRPGVEAGPGGRPGVEAGPGGPLVVVGADLVRAVVEDLGRGAPPPVVAARFHNGLAAVVVDVAVRLRAAHDVSVVALSGGVFQNLLLLERVVAGLRAHGFRALVHGRVPPNDGGISLGQVAVAVARDRARLMA